MRIIQLLMAGFFLLTVSCKKDDLGSKLGGETNLDFTKVGTVTNMNLRTDGGGNLAMSMSVISNNDGDVTYRVLVDFTGLPDSAALVNIIPDRYLDDQNRFMYDIKFRITSEGYQEYEEDSNTPFTILKYADGVGTEYTYTMNDGTVLKRTITEKTGLDDWYYGFLLIKTTEVTQTVFSPEGDAIFKTLKFRLNHKFGLVYMEAELENGVNGDLSLYTDL